MERARELITRDGSVDHYHAFMLTDLDASPRQSCHQC